MHSISTLNKVVELLRVSNADRATLMQSSGILIVANSYLSLPEALGVAAIKKLVKAADLATLESMLETARESKLRATAIKAIEEAMPGHSTIGVTQAATETKPVA